MGLINSEKRIKLIKSNQGMGLIKSSHDIKLWNLARFSITIDGMTINSNNQDTQ